MGAKYEETALAFAECAVILGDLKRLFHKIPRVKANVKEAIAKEIFECPPSRVNQVILARGVEKFFRETDVFEEG